MKVFMWRTLFPGAFLYYSEHLDIIKRLVTYMDWSYSSGLGELIISRSIPDSDL